MIDLTYAIDNGTEYLTFRMTLNDNDFQDLLPKSIHLINGEKYQLIMIPTWQADFDKRIYDCFVILKKIKK